MAKAEATRFGSDRITQGDRELAVAYVGSSRGMERTLVPPTGTPTFLFAMAPPTSWRGLLLVSATARTLWLFRRLRPRVTFATGGYVSAPAALASWLCRVPVVLFLPDIVPGRAVSWLAPLSRVIAVSAAGSRRSLPRHKVVVTGYPVRPEFLTASRQAGRRRLGISPEATMLCVFGGSQGSRAINTGLAGCLPALLDRYDVVHICGRERMDEAKAAAATLSPEQQARYVLYPYLDGAAMADCLAAADLALCRSGASTLGELPVTATPAVLVPFPDPAVHQQENAEYLADHGAAIVVADAELPERLSNVLFTLLGDRARLQHMAQNCAALARPDAAGALGELLSRYAL